MVVKKSTKKIVNNTTSTTISEYQKDILDAEKYKKEQETVKQLEIAQLLLQQKEIEKTKLENEEKIKAEIIIQQQKDIEERKAKQAEADSIIAQLDSRSKYIDNQIIAIEQQIANKKSEIDGLRGRGISTRIVEGKIAQIEAKYGNIEGQYQELLFIKGEITRVKYKIEYWLNKNIPLTAADINLLASWGIEL